MSKNENILLVEGNDDQHVFWNIFLAYSTPEVFSVEQCGSDSGVLKELGVRLKGSQTHAIGVVLDADVSPEGRWSSIKTILKRIGYLRIPDAPNPSGTVVLEEGKPRIGIWLMPNNVTQGMLEDFICSLIPKDDGLFTYAKQCISDMSSELRLFSVAHQSKAEIHTWLAWQKEPGTPMGLAITKKYLDPTKGNVEEFLKWVDDLFIEGVSRGSF